VLAKAFDKEFKAFYHYLIFVPELLFKLELLGTYDRFIERKYEICLQEKVKIPKTQRFFAKEAQRELIKKIVKCYHITALKVLFVVEEVALLLINNQCVYFE
jgi:hypothetical protein